MVEFKIRISEETIKRLRSSIIVADISGRGLSMSEEFTAKLIALIGRGITEQTFDINDKNKG